MFDSPKAGNDVVEAGVGDLEEEPNPAECSIAKQRPCKGLYRTIKEFLLQIWPQTANYFQFVASSVRLGGKSL
jgi:hypothetical protein